MTIRCLRFNEGKERAGAVVMGTMIRAAAINMGAVLISSMVAGPLRAQAFPNLPDGPNVRVTVTATMRGASAPPALTSADVLVYQSHKRRPVVSWRPVRSDGGGTELAILIDDSAGPSFDNQIRDLKAFIDSLPHAMQVAVVYAEHSDASFLQNFTSNHALAAKALRLPLGRANEESSIYMAVSDLVKHLPKNNELHEILLVSDGIDLYRGVMDSEPGVNPDLNTALHDAARANVTVYTIFANAAGLYNRSLFLINNGQSCLSLLTLSTGGESFFQGLNTPVSFRPYLEQLAKLLSSQYILTFNAAPLEKPGMAPIRITTERPRVQLMAPQNVYVPAA
jgi:hypothetical protein